MSIAASRLTRVTLDETQIIITGSATVRSILISNPTSSAIECVFKNNDNVSILNITVPAQTSFDYDVIFVADKGLKVDGLDNADVVVTVAHGADGA
jgi:hypothetical protein